MKSRIALLGLSLALSQTVAAVPSVAAGANHSLFLRGDGTVWGWGDNTFGEVSGDGTTAVHLSPVQVGGITGVTAVSAGGDFSLAVKSDGTVWAWGANQFGQLGDGTTTNRLSPVQVTGIAGVVSVSACGEVSLAVKSDGTVWAWGLNTSGQLGDGTTTNRLSPVQVAGITGVAAASAGGDFSLAVKSDGTVWAWGANTSGQLGDGSAPINTNQTKPVQVNVAVLQNGAVESYSAITGVLGISANNLTGLDFSLAVKSDGTVWGWGDNTFGEVTSGLAQADHPFTPIQVVGSGLSALTNVLSASAGQGFSLAVKSDGTVWGWGSDQFGQMGNGTSYGNGTPNGASGASQFSQVQVSGIAGVVVVAAGGGFGLAVKNDGTVWSWGLNASGQLGDGTTTNRLTPVQVQLPTAAIISISAGGIVNSATFAAGAPVAPGSLASVYGTFPIATAQSTVAPWPTVLSGLSVQFSGIFAPLSYASATQVNVQIPWELAGQTQVLATATNGSETSAQQALALASFAPGVFMLNSQGQGAVVNALSGQIISPSNPATAGVTYISVYCTGLGPVSNQPATGAAASANPLSQTITPPTVTIGGVTAGILFSGLAPSFVGLYQINVQVPASAPLGDAVPLAISISGATAPTVTIAVQAAGS